MTPNPKKNSTLWYSCDTCKCIISFKDLKEHQPEICQNIEESCKIYWNHAFIKDSSMFGFLEEYKYSTDVPECLVKDVVCLSVPALQKCKFVIGDPVIVITNNEGRGTFHGEIKTAWPIKEGAVTSVFCPKQSMESSYGLNYGPVVVKKFTNRKNKAIPASKFIFDFTKQSDIPKNMDAFISLLGNRIRDKIIHSNSRILLNFYGKPVKITITKIESVKYDLSAETNVDVDDFANGFDEKLNLTEEYKENLITKYNEYINGLKFFIITDNTKIVCNNDFAISSNDLNSNHKARSEEFDTIGIGGYKDAVDNLNRLINRCLNISKSDFQYKGANHIHGTLLHGMSGVGKTYIADVLAYKSKAHIVDIHCGDVFNKSYLEAESRLRSLFKDAKSNAPSIILLNDVETLCPKRTSSDRERRVSKMLLSLLDLLHDEEVFVLATTRELDLIDPSLRRPGRLDKEIELVPPLPSDREDILIRMLKNTGYFTNEKMISSIAAATHGYVAADLRAVVVQANTKAVMSNETITEETLTWALSQVKPSAMREVYVEIPNVKWSDIGGQEKLKLQLQRAVEWPHKYPEAFAHYNVTPPRGILMFGPPGCSKTMIAKALATESKLNFISIKGPELFSKWVGESEKAVRDLFRRARSVAPSIVFMDELDAIAGRREYGNKDGGGSASVQERVLAQILTELDGVKPLQGVFILAATNRPDRIDKALLRPGRLDRLVYVPLPDFPTRKEILCIQFQKTPVASDIIIDKLAESMDGYSGAEVIAVCHESALIAMEEDPMNASQVKLCHFQEALKTIPPRTPNSLLKLYEEYS